MIDDDGRVKVLDFGLAKQLNGQSSDTLGSEAEAPTRLSAETLSGVVLGTPAYLSPEQAMGLAVDGRSDLFALGVVLYEATTGKTPFHGTNFIEIAANVLHFEPRAASKLNPAIPQQLDFIISKALQKKKEKRYQSATEMIADLVSVKDSLEHDSGQTLIRKSSTHSQSIHSRTYSHLSQMLQRPRVPVLHLIVGVVALAVAFFIGWRLLRPAPHKPTAEAQRWYDIGANALRDSAYFQASQAFEKSIAADDAFMLAHARLAEALVELDLVDRAKNELLRVNAVDRSKLSNEDALYLDAVSATARHDFAKAVQFYQQLVELASEGEKPYVLVDLGRAYKNNNEVNKAIESFSEAANRNPQYATAYLHLGILYGQQGDSPKAESSFAKAESIYRALGNLEGRAEVGFQRGALFNKRNQIAEARTQLENALSLAKAADNKALLIRCQLQLSSVYFDAGETERATQYAGEAVALAQRFGMESLSSQGLTDLGNSFLVRGDLAEAEKYLQQALESAQRAQARRNESRARVSLASLRGRQNDYHAAASYLEPALAFYQEGGYLSETFSCLALLARVQLKSGDYAGAAKAHEQLLELANKLNDPSLRALAYAEKGSALAREEKFSAALEQLNEAYTLYSAQGVQRSIGYNLLARANCLVQLGRYDEANSLLEQAAGIANRPGGELKALSADLKLMSAEISLAQENFSEALKKAQELVRAVGSTFPEVEGSSKRLLGLSQAHVGTTNSAIQNCESALQIAIRSNDDLQVARSNLALAEVLIMKKQADVAVSAALAAQKSFNAGGQKESEWRSLLMAALASEQLGNTEKAGAYRAQASQVLSTLQQRWGTDNYNTYLMRPDVQRLRKQLGLSSSL
jgi:tetratricopeptide (TPR) repeat protein